MLNFADNCSTAPQHSSFGSEFGPSKDSEENYSAINVSAGAGQSDIDDIDFAGEPSFDQHTVRIQYDQRSFRKKSNTYGTGMCRPLLLHTVPSCLVQLRHISQRLSLLYVQFSRKNYFRASCTHSDLGRIFCNVFCIPRCRSSVPEKILLVFPETREKM